MFYIGFKLLLYIVIGNEGDIKRVNFQYIVDMNEILTTVPEVCERATVPVMTS